MKIVLDVCLSPLWKPLLDDAAFSCVDWRQVGNRTDTDIQILRWAAENNHVVLTNDLDFGRLAAYDLAAEASVVLLRVPDARPAVVGNLVIAVLKKYQAELEAGALLVVELERNRIRVLPFTR